MIINENGIDILKKIRSEMKKRSRWGKRKLIKRIEGMVVIEVKIVLREIWRNIGWKRNMEEGRNRIVKKRKGKIEKKKRIERIKFLR